MKKDPIPWTTTTPHTLTVLYRDVTGCIPSTSINILGMHSFLPFTELIRITQFTLQPPKEMKESRPGYKSYQPIAIKHIEILNPPKKADFVMIRLPNYISQTLCCCPSNVLPIYKLTGATLLPIPPLMAHFIDKIQLSHLKQFQLQNNLSHKKLTSSSIHLQ